MSAGLWTQYLLLAAAVTASIAYMLRKLAPSASIRLQARLAATLSRSDRPAAMRRLARLLKPREATGECGGGCGSCGSCGSDTPPSGTAREQTVRFHSRGRRP